MKCVLVLLAIAGPAHAGRLCAPGVAHAGARIDLDLDGAPIAAALRLVADVAHAGLAIGDGVAGKITLHLRHVPWDAAACAIAAVSHIELRLDDGVLIAKKR